MIGDAGHSENPIAQPVRNEANLDPKPEEVKFGTKPEEQAQIIDFVKTGKLEGSDLPSFLTKMTDSNVSEEDAARIRGVLDALAHRSWFKDLTPEHQRISAVEAARLANAGYPANKEKIWKEFATQWERVAIAEQTATKAGQYIGRFRKPVKPR